MLNVCKLISNNALCFAKEDWGNRSAAIIESAILDAIKKNGICTLMLTGGNSAEKVYRKWSEEKFIKKYGNKIHFYITDERCVSSRSIHSNSKKIINVLFDGKVPSYINYFNFGDVDKDIKGALINYDSLLPSRMDIILLSIGEDGHIASIFPDKARTRLSIGSMFLSESSEHLFKRVSVKPSYIANANKIFVLANGKLRSRYMSYLDMCNENKFKQIKLAIKNATWLIAEE
ncbi:6-phosphogluconolactonase [Polynucleobacter sp. AP-Ainpum-60-G11]|uniref:6-phosphogluconolactonase n=1 Tax=Polynucleobacter sp. AP-Ainpum-60-G11 TaxID=2576926 RepID=UPI001BFD4DF9|nr:6-phosphogluconolactonase [Polynucleobacter sp. AP-Ainpum-60-G11]QWE27010.1 6-phosphogluconolactonase [Polynucleobacter sp. AP-Ainpum-60-G11]